jgi:N-acetylglutamate synthase-like GNAT family acetyltransferase
MRLRSPEVKELEDILKMEKELTHRDMELEEFRKNFERWPELYIVAEEDGELVGEASGEVEDGKVLLESISVKDGFRCEGIGRKILEKFCDRASKYSGTVSVASADDVERFYRRYDFSPVKILLQARKEDLPAGWKNDGRVLDWREEDETILIYASFDEYSGDVREDLKKEFNAFEVNCILEKKL